MSCPAKQQAFTRNRYDDFHQVDDNRISTYSSRYMLNPPAFNCPTTYPANATVRLQKSGDAWVSGQWRTDVESDLKGIGRLDSRIRCDSALYNPATNEMNQRSLSNAPDQVVPLSFMRLVDPPCTLRATGWNRWTPLFHNPQETFETPFDFFIPSRFQDKEKYNTHSPRSCWVVNGQDYRLSSLPDVIPDYAG
jgi:hypothetical protein